MKTNKKKLNMARFCEKVLRISFTGNWNDEEEVDDFIDTFYNTAIEVMEETYKIYEDGLRNS